ncbi:hypothetical protein [Azospirillum sp. TSA6c]|uniref:hypothetical protein n=1 Tax=unclassified Azospirillum TaxID=2630922 RepID=UPI0011B457A4|nr:hypothetical protein [Azospirillum sp. TSA6c]
MIFDRSGFIFDYTMIYFSTMERALIAAGTLVAVLCCKVGRQAAEWLKVGPSQAVSDFKGRYFEGEILLWAVRWHRRYALRGC